MPSVLANQQILLKSRPEGFPSESNFEIVKGEISQDLSGSQDVLVQLLDLSVDPYLRGRMNAGKSYVPAFELGKPLYSGALGKVVKSSNSSFKDGDIVFGSLHWANYTRVPEGKGLTKIDTSAGLPLSYYLGVLGMTGLTAYAGLLEIGKPKEGETVYVSAASGAVGQIVGQIAKLKGCRVVGSAGTDEKVKLLKEKFAYDAAFNYKTCKDLTATLQELCPNGIDIYFENVGGEMLEAVLDVCNKNARIPTCGMISQYNVPDKVGVRNLFQVIYKRLLIQGFIVGDYLPTLGVQFKKDMSQWLKEGKMNYLDDVTHGLENAPKAFIGMLHGENVGKAVVKVAEP
ncbi:hypothetical protein ABBQ38_001466 [Trebouxia sp. C0009 RCD-2024]